MLKLSRNALSLGCRAPYCVRNASAKSTETKPEKSPVVGNYLDLSLNQYRSIKKFSDLPQTFGHNQHIAIDNDLKEQMRQTLWKFKAPIRYAFGYGSGVFSQGIASAKSKPQIDMIFGVSHTQHWHSLNMKQNPEHYSGLRLLGSGAVGYVQDNIGAGVYFNPYVQLNGMTIKYGVVNMDTLLRDLSQWDTLYMAGRLHKPVKILRDDPRVRFLNQANLISVLRTALLLLPEKFSEKELYMSIANVSYMGDPRMTFGENPNKVKNIVENQFLNFRRLYSPLMDGLPNIGMISSSSEKLVNSEVEIASLHQDMDPNKRGNMVVRLPAEFKSKIYSRYANRLKGDNNDPHLQEALGKSVTTDNSVTFATDFDKRIAADSSLNQEIASSIKHTVGWTSAIQSAKGILTAGLVRSVKYSGEKLKKYYTK